MFGIHTGIQYNIYIEKFKELNTIQLFTHGPRSTKKINIDIKEFCSKTKKINVFVHSSYLTIWWSEKPYIINHILDQIKVSISIKAKGFVVHLPQINPNLLIEKIKQLLSLINNKNLKIIFEMTSIGDKNIYSKPEQLNELINIFINNKITHKEVGICIDTAHIYTGSAKIYTYNEAKKYIQSIKNKKYIASFHLNGNEYKYDGSSGDKHAIPLDSKDKIWKNIDYKSSGCKFIIDWCKKNKTSYILEINPERHTIKGIQKFINLVYDNR